MQLQTRRCAIITGSSRGIGAACAERFARDGFAVVINYFANATVNGSTTRLSALTAA